MFHCCCTREVQEHQVHDSLQTAVCPTVHHTDDGDYMNSHLCLMLQNQCKSFGTVYITSQQSQSLSLISQILKALRTRNARGPVALCTMGLGLLNPPSSRVGKGVPAIAGKV